MDIISFTTLVHAPKEKVQNTMLEDATYRQWTEPFNPTGSFFEGDWSEGSTMRFLGSNPDGTKSGMKSLVKESRPYDFISVQHLGEIRKGEEVLLVGEGTPNTEMFENYTLTEKDGATEVLVELTSSTDFPAEYRNMFESMWPKALEKVKALAES